MKFASSILTLLGRWAIAAIFLLSGILKFVFYSSTLNYMASQGVPYTAVLLILAALTEILFGLFIILGWKTRWSAFALLLYLIPVTYVFHDFWNIEEPMQAQLQFFQFLKNLAIFGGLLLLVSRGAGSLAIDACCHHDHPEQN